MTPAAELALLRNKLAASERMGEGYAARCEVLRVRIAEMEKPRG